MKRTLIGLIVLLVVSTAAMVVQNPDAATIAYPQVSFPPQVHINVAGTGNVVDRAGFAGAMFTVIQGHVTNGSGAASFQVLQDSSVTPAQVWTAVDSIAVDTVQPSKTYLGSKRYLRIVSRANTASTDTCIIAVPITLVGKRTRP
jgi:hypothetical protein